MTKVYFGHGLGDCVHSAHQLPLYTRRGHQITVACDPDKQVLFKPCLDSLDTEFPGAADRTLREIQAAYPQPRETSMVVCDDTAYCQRQFRGKGAQAVPWLLERGWKILHSEHQCVLSRMT